MAASRRRISTPAQAPEPFKPIFYSHETIAKAGYRHLMDCGHDAPSVGLIQREAYERDLPMEALRGFRISADGEWALFVNTAVSGSFVSHPILPRS